VVSSPSSLVQVGNNAFDVGKDVKTPAYRNPIVENLVLMGEIKPEGYSGSFGDSSDMPGDGTDLHEVEDSLSPRQTPIFVTKTGYGDSKTGGGGGGGGGEVPELELTSVPNCLVQNGEQSTQKIQYNISSLVPVMNNNNFKSSHNNQGGTSKISFCPFFTRDEENMNFSEPFILNEISMSTSQITQPTSVDFSVNSSCVSSSLFKNYSVHSNKDLYDCNVNGQPQHQLFAGNRSQEHQLFHPKIDTTSREDGLVNQQIHSLSHINSFQSPLYDTGFDMLDPFQLPSDV
jgi:hypothetical protein